MTGYHTTSPRKKQFTRSYLPVDIFQFEASDDEDYDILQHVTGARDFIDSARAEGGRVLVHCARGVNRSGAICVAYLMITTRRDLMAVVRCVSDVGFRRDGDSGSIQAGGGFRVPCRDLCGFFFEFVHSTWTLETEGVCVIVLKSRQKLIHVVEICLALDALVEPRICVAMEHAVPLLWFQTVVLLPWFQTGETASRPHSDQRRLPAPAD